MSNISCRLVTAAMLSVMLIGCEEPPTSTPLSPSHPSFDGAGPPPASGFVVTRDETVIGFLAFNFDVPFVVIMDARNGNPFCGVPVTEVRPIESQHVENPSGSLNIVNRARLFTRVYASVSIEEFLAIPVVFRQVLCSPRERSGSSRAGRTSARCSEKTGGRARPSFILPSMASSKTKAVGP